jgi:putative addiction module component (TIGR02574 family)
LATTREEIYRAALGLKEGERAELAALLLESLDTEAEEGVESAWIVEIDSRIKQLDSGAVAAIPWEEARARLHRLCDQRS